MNHALWQGTDTGYERTRNTALIATELKRLMDNRVHITLVQRGYQSGNTVLIGVSDSRLAIDKPRDWPDTQAALRVAYRDANRLWCHFPTKVLAVGEDTVEVCCPTELLRLQRRAHYRVAPPAGTSASFHIRGNGQHKGGLRDISAGGMLLCTNKQILANGETINDIRIEIPPTDGSRRWHLAIPAGTVVHASRSMEEKSYCFGISFQVKPRDEENIVQFVRQRELELLRKGIH